VDAILYTNLSISPNELPFAVMGYSTWPRWDGFTDGATVVSGRRYSVFQQVEKAQAPNKESYSKPALLRDHLSAPFRSAAIDRDPANILYSIETGVAAPCEGRRNK